MATADRLLKLMFSWMEEKENCAEQLKKLAQELESLREKCNKAECLGSYMSVVGAACVIGAATFVTGGAAVPFLGVVGLGSSGVGTTISVATKITEYFKSKNTMKEAMKVEQKSNEIREEIQKLFEQLKAEKKKLSPEANPDELDQHVMAEFLTAVGKRSKVKGKIFVRTVNNEPVFFLNSGLEYERLGFSSNQSWSRFHAGQMMPNFTPAVTVLVAGMLAIFAMQAGGKSSKLLFAKGLEQLIKLMSSAAFKTTLKGAMAVGGAALMAFSLSEAIDNWTDLIKNNFKTEASKAMRDTADNILKSTQTLREQFNKIMSEFKEMAEQHEAEIRQREAERQKHEIVREKCSINEDADSSVFVLGASCLIGAGAAAPVFGLAGVVSSGAGANISVAAKITENLISSDAIKEVIRVDKKSSKIGEEIQQLYKQVKAEKKKLSPDADPDELDQHVMAEFLTAIGEKSGVMGKIIFRTVNEPEFFLDAGPGYETLSFSSNESGSRFHAAHMMLDFSPELTLLVAAMLAIFAMQASGKRDVARTAEETGKQNQKTTTT